MIAMRRVGRCGASLLACVLVAGVTSPPAMATPEGQSTSMYGQPPVWGGCEQFVGDASAIPTAQCGAVSIPVDYANPEGAEAQLAIIRIPASGDRIGNDALRHSLASSSRPPDHSRTRARWS